eukprot:15726_1
MGAGIIAGYFALGKLRILAQSSKTIAESTQTPSNKVSQRPISFLVYGNRFEMVPAICSTVLYVFGFALHSKGVINFKCKSMSFMYIYQEKGFFMEQLVYRSIMYPLETIKTVNVADIKQTEDRKAWNVMRYFAGAPIGIAHDVIWFFLINLIDNFVNETNEQVPMKKYFINICIATLLTYPMSTISTRQKLKPKESIWEAAKALLSKRTNKKLLILYDGIIFELGMCFICYTPIYGQAKVMARSLQKYDDEWAELEAMMKTSYSDELTV